MLQFNATLCAAMVKSIPKSPWRIPRLLSSMSNPHEQVVPAEKNVQKSSDESNSESQKTDLGGSTTQNNMSAQQEQTDKPPLTDSVLKNAKSANDYLILVQNYQLSKQNTFKIMSGIMHLINGGHAKIEDMLTDSRFEKLQQSIAAMDVNSYDQQKAEMAVKYGCLSTIEMIKVLWDMTKSGSKNIDTMKYLTDQIILYNTKLTPDHCKRLLSCMISMNFQHKVLLNKICKQLITNSSKMTLDIIQDVVTSLGILKYKDNLLFDVMCTYMLYTKSIIPPNDLSSMLLTYATLGYYTPKVEIIIKKHIHPLKWTNFSNNIKWLNLVWSLAVLNMAQKEHYESVLSNEFLASVAEVGKWTISNKLKLLNLKAAADIEYGDSLGPIDLAAAGDLNIALRYSPYRQKLLDTLDETMKEMLSSKTHYKTNINTGMGFCIDAECYVDSDGKFEVEDSTNVTKRVAIVLLSLADYCRGEGDLIGAIKFKERLLKARGYTVVHISEKFFSPVDTASKRLMYLKDQITNAINLRK